MTRKSASAWCKAFRNGRADPLEKQQHRHLNSSLRAVHDIVHSTCGYGTVPAHCIPQQLGEHSFKMKAVQSERTLQTARHCSAVWRRVAQISASRDRNS